MDTKTMIRNLEKVEADHKNDKVFTGQLNIAAMAHDARKRLEELKPYEDTGLTPEEVRELKERDTAKAARPISDRSLYGICLNCGQTIFRDHRFCPECGQRLKEDK